MPLIALRCPQCGGEIQLDSVREIGFCMYCGSKVVLQEALNHQVTVDETHKLESWIALGYEALRAKNYVDAERYANKIIETDLKNPAAWYIKGCCATDVQIATQQWKTALSYADKSKPLWNYIVSALNDPFNYFQSRRRTVTFIRGSAIGGSARHFHIYINEAEQFALGNGESRSLVLEEGSYMITGRIASYKMRVPLNVNKNMNVYINLNKRENKWDVIAN